MLVPFALEVRRRYLRGETIEQLSAELGIPTDRIERRLRVAEAYVEHQRSSGACRLTPLNRPVGLEPRLCIVPGSSGKVRSSALRAGTGPGCS